MQGRRPLGPAFLVAVLVLAFAAPAAAGSGDRAVTPAEPPPWERDDTPEGAFADDLWFVEFSAAPRARGGAAARLQQERTQFRADAAREGVPVRIRNDHRVLWNGLTVRADIAEIATLRQSPAVTAIHPVAIIEAPQPQSVEPLILEALAMTGADTAQSELGYTGAGLSVAIIDTGIDYNHPDLGGDGDRDRRLQAGPDRRLAHPRITHGWDYVGDQFNPADPNAPLDPAPNPDPIDLEGHGTHVAGIVGADAADDTGVTGVAPGVTFGAYKVFGPGSTTADIIVDALEDAYLDGMDIVNMSLGAAFAWGQDYPTTRASNELAAQGVAVVNSAGNSGGSGTWTLSAPANAHDIISVASADNTRQQTNVFEVEQLDAPVPYLELSGAPQPPTEGESAPVVWLGRACTSLGDQLLGDPSGAVALISRGDCTFAEKYLAAANAGATGVVIHNNASGLFAGTVGGDGRADVWGAGISRESGLAIRALLDQGETVTFQFTPDRVSIDNPTGGLVSSFSSYGQDVELEFGPSIMAPGGLITSTYPLTISDGYAMLSGTSMAAPHVAGAVALLWEAEPDLDPIAVRDRLQNTAVPAPWSLNAGLGLPDHTFRQGAGMLQIDEAILAQQDVRPGQLSLGDQDTTTASVVVRNRGDRAVTYTVSHDAALEVAASTFTPDFFLFGASVDAPATVTVPAGGSTEVTVTITAPQSGLPNHQYGGYLVMTPDDDAASTLRVPYAGYAGDYVGEMGLLGYWDWPAADDAPSFVDVPPVLAERTDDGLAVAQPGTRFSVRQGDVPVIAAFFGHFPQRMEVYAVDQRTGRSQLALQDDFLPRSPAIGERWTFAWNGMVRAGNSQNFRPVPSGDYVLEMRVLRALGDASNPDHWETWTSPRFTVDSRGGPPPRP